MQKHCVGTFNNISPLQEYLKLRLAHISNLKEIGESPYPHKFNVTISLSDFIEKYQDLKEGEHHEDVVSVAGLFHRFQQIKDVPVSIC